MAPFATPPRMSSDDSSNSGQAEIHRGMVTPNGRSKPSYIPLPTHLTCSTTASHGLGRQAERSESALHHSPLEHTRTGRSSSLSMTNQRSGTPTAGMQLRQISRPSFSVVGTTGIPTTGQNGRASVAAGGWHGRSDSLGSNNSGEAESTAGSSGGAPESNGASGSVDALGSIGMAAADAERRFSLATDESDGGERVLPVKVAVRIRPLVVGNGGAAENNGAGWAATRHARGQLTSCIEALSNSTIQVSAGVGGEEAGVGGRHSSAARTFNVDYAFGADATQRGVYEASVAPLLARFVEGYNVTVLAYGQTSSGKTHTMGTDGGEAGIVPRALQWLFAWAQAGGHGAGLRRGVDIRISFIEVYNEDLIDLVAQAQGHGVRPPIFVREDAKGNILWTGVKEVAVASAEAAMALLADGSRERQTWGTRMNATSSRSHAIYSVSLTQTRGRGTGGSGDQGGEADNAAETVRIVSKLHFVDLAGSERLKKTMAVGERQREGISINSGLLALGNVISALGDANRGPLAHVPYRESKLTYMLRDSLGGSAQTLLIACVSAAEANAAESINTLKYAARARNIKNRGGVNMVAVSRSSAKEVETLRAMVRRLKGEVRELQERLRSVDCQPHGAAVNGSQLGNMSRYSPVRPDSLLLADETPSRIPTREAALLQRRAQTAEELHASRPQSLAQSTEELHALKTRNQTLETELEQLNDTYTELLLKFNDACREIEDRQNEGFERGQRLRHREHELRLLTSQSHHDRNAVASIVESVDLSRPSSVADSLLRRRRSTQARSVAEPEPTDTAASQAPASVPNLPPLTHLNSLRAASVVSSTDSPHATEPGPGAAEFDAILEDYDTCMRTLEDELSAVREELDGLKTQLALQESKASFAEKLAASQLAQIDTLRQHVAKARAAADDEEQRRRALEAELEDAHFHAETHLESVSSEWRLELQQVDEQWNERWAAAADEHRAEIDRLHAARAEDHAEIERLRADLRSESVKLVQLMSPPPTAHDIHHESVVAEPRSHVSATAESGTRDVAVVDPVADNSADYAAENARLNARLEQLERELQKSVRATKHLELELHNYSEAAEKAEAELRVSRTQALDAEARAIRAEEALAAQQATQSAAQPVVMRSYSDLPQRTSDKIILCARNSIAQKGDASAADAPAADVASSAEQRLRAMGGHRYSTMPQQATAPLSPGADKLTSSYPELRLATSTPSTESPVPGFGTNGRPLPVYDEVHIQNMLREAAAEVDQDARHERERNSLNAEIARLKEKANDLQGRNSQLKNLMRDLGDRLVGLAEENDMLEAKAADRDSLAKEVASLSDTVEDLRSQLQQLELSREEEAEGEELTPQLRQMQARLESLEAELADAVDRANQAEDNAARQSNELLRARADADAIAKQLEDTHALVMREARDRDIWKGRSQDLREELAEIRSTSRRRSKLFCFH
ncbi:hypothetical protein H4R20_000241 [Coemansia guatemalensis]|uniref:Kinesin motor domain-containing protein n=1 Tax=Coemansia guatemalensis TaxID=2761395 RepID=A0A9W8I1G0_9FUNG|nr:hypothetical protein H4R20_000241 [Coemansia guatemalensis]